MAGDTYNLTSKISYVILMGTGIAIVLGTWVGQLGDLSANIDRESLTKYDESLAAEALLNTGPRRSFINASKLASNDNVCYKNSSKYLKQGRFGVKINSQYINDNKLQNHYNVECTGTVSPSQSFNTRIFLINETIEQEENERIFYVENSSYNKVTAEAFIYNED